MNYFEELIQLREALKRVSSQAKAVEVTRHILKQTAPGDGFVHLTPIALSSGRTRWIDSGELLLSGFPRPLRFAYLNRDFVVWTPFSSPDVQFLKCLDQASIALHDALKRLPPPTPPCLVSGRQTLELELQAALAKFGEASLCCIRVQGYHDVIGLLGPEAAEGLLEEVRRALATDAPDLTMARYRQDRFLILSTDNAAVRTLSSHTRRVLARCDLPVGLTLKTVQAVLGGKTVLDWIAEVERLVNDVPFFGVGLRSVESPSGEGEGPLTLSPRGPIPPSPFLFSMKAWPDEDPFSADLP